jgi:hypothetical protein
MLLDILKGLLREEIEAICKNEFVFVWRFQLYMLFLVPISMDNQELVDLKLLFLSTILLLSVKNHN